MLIRYFWHWEKVISVFPCIGRPDKIWRKVLYLSRTFFSTWENTHRARYDVLPHLHSLPMPIIFPGQWTSSIASRTEVLQLYQNFPWGWERLVNVEFQPPLLPPTPHRGFDSVYLRWDIGIYILTSSLGSIWGHTLWVFLEDFSHWKNSSFPHVN